MTGLPARALQVIEAPCRPLSEIGACFDSREPVTADLHKLSAGRCDYYVREVARDHEEYLSGHGESPGEFLGAGSAALGKSGGVCSGREFRRLFAWHPDTGEQLGRAPRSDAMPAWDLVLRPVKDVAILYALGDQHAGRAWGTPTRPAWTLRSATWMGRSGLARAEMGRSMSGVGAGGGRVHPPGQPVRRSAAPHPLGDRQPHPRP